MAEAQTLINYKSHLISDSGGGEFPEEIGEAYERAVYSSSQKFSCGVHIPVRIPVHSPAAEGQVHPEPVCVRLIQVSLPFTCCHRFSVLGKHDLEHLASCHNAHLWEICNSVTPKTVIPVGRLSACLKAWSAQPELWFLEGGKKVSFVYLFLFCFSS